MIHDELDPLAGPFCWMFTAHHGSRRKPRACELRACVCLQLTVQVQQLDVTPILAWDLVLGTSAMPLPSAVASVPLAGSPMCAGSRGGGGNVCSLESVRLVPRLPYPGRGCAAVWGTHSVQADAPAGGAGIGRSPAALTHHK